jgi:hypothetical protein
MLPIIFMSCEMKCGDYENKRMILRDMLLHIVEH